MLRTKMPKAVYASVWHVREPLVPFKRKIQKKIRKEKFRRHQIIAKIYIKNREKI